MRVLLTRAAEDAARTRATLEKLGHHVLVSPVIAIKSTNAEWPAGVVDAVLATSGQAFVTIHKDWGPAPEARRLMPMWLVGQRTAQVAFETGFVGEVHVATNAVSLACEMNKECRFERIVYLAGRDRKPDIELALAVTNPRMEVIEVYEAKSVDYLEEQAKAAIAQDGLDAVLHFSKRSAELFTLAVERGSVPTRALHLCISDDAALPLRDAGWHVEVAAEPTESSLISTLAQI